MIIRTTMFVTTAALILLISGIAHATPLDDAVASYNLQAADLQDSWDEFQLAQDAAFDDVDDMLTGMYYYFSLIVDDPQQAETYWQSHLDAIDSLDTQTAAPVDETLEILLDNLDSTAKQLQIVHQLDMADANYLVYDTGTMHFELPLTPFLFWTEPTQDTPLGWMEYDFPVLAVGDPLLHDFYVPLNLGEFLQFLGDLYDWLDFAYWVYKHKDDAHHMNDEGGAIFDALCAYCGPNNLNFSVDSCFTQTKVDSWCTTFGDSSEYSGANNYCIDLQYADDKNAEVQRHFECYGYEHIAEVMDIAEDNVVPWWWHKLPFLN